MKFTAQQTNTIQERQKTPATTQFSWTEQDMKFTVVETTMECTQFPSTRVRLPKVRKEPQRSIAFDF